MIRQRTLLMMVAGISILSLGSVLHAGVTVTLARPVGPVVVTPRIGLGVWIGGPVVEPPCHAPAHSRLVVTRPWRDRFVRLGAPRAEAVVVHPPAVRRVMLDRSPVVVTRAPTVMEEGPITVWITNSNGSRTSVKLTRHGSGYIGPQGEYYTGMPANEQLRMVYGF
jgi:hypothetical protein